MGEILVDFLPIEEGGRTVGFGMHAGGSPFNVAIGLARLGQRVAFASKASGDLFGRFLREHLHAEGVDTRFLLPSESPSTLAFVAMQGGEPEYAFYGDNAADTLLTSEEVPPLLLEETDVLHFGSISLLRGTTPAAVLATAERLKGKALLSFDPNVRPGLVRDETAYRHLLDSLFALADIAKVSTADLAWLAPGEPPEDAASRLLARGPALMIVTLGSLGVLALSAHERWEVPAFPVEVADTVGAGDAFTSGLLASLAEGEITSRSRLEALGFDELESALRFAAATSALTCTRRGADPPTLEEVARFLSGIANHK